MGETLMTVSTRFTFARFLALLALGLPLGFLAGYIAATSSGSLWAIAAAVAAVAVALWGCDRLANRAALRLGSTQLPWSLYAAITLSFWVGAAAILEIGALFAANDAGSASGRALVPAMMATGAVGVASAAATAIIAVVLIVWLLQSRPAQLSH